VIAERTAETITTSLSFFWRIAAFADEGCVDMVVDEEREVVPMLYNKGTKYTRSKSHASYLDFFFRFRRCRILSVTAKMARSRPRLVHHLSPYLTQNTKGAKFSISLCNLNLTV
jgi:hypothetical protein